MLWTNAGLLYYNKNPRIEITPGYTSPFPSPVLLFSCIVVNSKDCKFEVIARDGCGSENIARCIGSKCAPQGSGGRSAFASFFLFCLFPFLSRFMGNQTDKMMALYRVCIDNFNDTCGKVTNLSHLTSAVISNRRAMNIPQELTFNNRDIFRPHENQT